jgi:hypothetical protein
MRSLSLPLPLLVVVCLFPLLAGSFTPAMTYHRSSSRRSRRRMTCSTSSLKVAATTKLTANNNSILPRLVSSSSDDNTNNDDRSSDDNPRIGVLLLNLGGPETGDDVEGRIVGTIRDIQLAPFCFPFLTTQVDQNIYIHTKFTPQVSCTISLLIRILFDCRIS